MRTRFYFALLLILGLAPGLASPCLGQSPNSGGAGTEQANSGRIGGEAAKPASGTIGRESMLRLVQQANPMLWPLLLCSIVVVAYILERSFALRRGRVLPKEFGKRFLERLAQGKLDRERAQELCKANDSPLARVLGHAVRYWGQPAATIRTALDHDAASEILDLRRNVRVLNGTATLAPLLGLLGTVIGMIESFDAVGGDRFNNASRSEALAHGISLALLATAFGLAIAVVSVVFYYFFQQRVDALMRDLDDQARQVIDLISAEAQRVPTSRGPILPASPEYAPNLEPGRAGRSLGRVDTA